LVRCKTLRVAIRDLRLWNQLARMTLPSKLGVRRLILRRLAEKARVHGTYVGRLERGETGMTVEALAAILATLGSGLGEFFQPFRHVARVRTPRRRG